MEPREYPLFGVYIEALGDQFQTRVAQSPVGEARHKFELPFSDAELEEIGLLLRGGSANTNRDVNSEPVSNGQVHGGERAIQFGSRLFEAAFGGQIAERLHQSRVAAHTAGQLLRIRLRVDAEPRLAQVPWELLFDTNPDWRGFVALTRDTLLSRYLEVGRTADPVTVGREKLRVLVAIARPPAYAQLDADAEWLGMQLALRDPVLDGLVELERLDDASLPKLKTHLRARQHHVVHFIGHGDLDSNGQGVLLLVNEATQQGSLVSGDDVYRALQESRALRMVILNSCRGAQASRGDAFAGVAQRMLRGGLAAAVGMQSAISDSAAAGFAGELYAGIAAGMPIDAAMGSGRLAIRDLDRDSVEWATPVLFMRAPDARLFDVEVLTPAERKSNRLSTLWSEATAAQEEDNLPLAEARFRAILAEEPQHAQARDGLARVRADQDADRLFARGLQLMEDDKPFEAWSAFKELEDRHGNYRDVFSLQDILAERLRTSRVTKPDKPVPLIATPDSGGSGANDHAATVLNEILRGNVAIFLGTDANLIGNALDSDWAPGRRPPSTAQLAMYLAKMHAYPWPDTENLMRVAQFVEVTLGWSRLFTDVRDALTRSRESNALHRLLVRLPAQMRKNGAPGPLIIVSANYDDVLERTFLQSEEAFVLVTCLVQEGRLGKHLLHRPHGEEVRPIAVANEYVDLPFNASTGTIIVKIYAGINAGTGEADGYAITEDHHLDYSVRIDMSSLSQFIPVKLTQHLANKNFLFLGYSLRDWHLRAFLNALWPRGAGRGTYPWVVPNVPRAQDMPFWRGRDVDQTDATLEQYVTALSAGPALRAGANEGVTV